MTAIPPFPLIWPDGVPRAKAMKSSPFKVGLERAVADLLDALRLFGHETGLPVQDVVVSSNVSVAVKRPADPGVAVYFRWDGALRCIAVDRYPLPEANVRAIFMVIEARRQELRYGGFELVRATFAGFRSLPPPAAPLRRPWWEVLGVPSSASAELVEERFRALARSRHPDQPGGSAEAFAELSAAREASRVRVAS